MFDNLYGLGKEEHSQYWHFRERWNASKKWKK